jgi:DNA (cytosine-5)-methyltransferase 1
VEHVQDSSGRSFVSQHGFALGGSFLKTSLAGQSAAGVSRPGRRSEDDTNLVAHTLRAGPGGVGQGHNTNYVAETLRSHPRPGSNSNGAIITHALTSAGADASEDGSSRGTPLVPMAFNPKTGGDMRIGYGPKPTALSTTVETAVHSAAAVRRLTPLECERLQGFPDNWTATSNGKPQADAARYRQCGNAVAVPVVEWIARRTVAVDARSEAA